MRFHGSRSRRITFPNFFCTSWDFLAHLLYVDLDPLVSTCNLSNISTRGEVGTKAQILIAGFVVAGEVPKLVLVLGIGPRLADFQVAGTLADPYLQINKKATPEQFLVASNVSNLLGHLCEDAQVS